MRGLLNRVHGRELQFVAFALAVLLCIAAHIAGGLAKAPEAGGGWRRIDFPAVEARIEAGDLLTKEAQWYHPESAEESAATRTQPR